MAINRAQLVKELVPGLHALFGLEYDRYPNEHEEIFDTETSERAFEEHPREHSKEHSRSIRKSIRTINLNSI